MGGYRCQSCGRLFTGLTAFEVHRLGDYERLEEGRVVAGFSRRCRTDAELEARGLVRVQESDVWGRRAPKPGRSA